MIFLLASRRASEKSGRRLSRHHRRHLAGVLCRLVAPPSDEGFSGNYKDDQRFAEAARGAAWGILQANCSSTAAKNGIPDLFPPCVQLRSFLTIRCRKWD